MHPREGAKENILHPREGAEEKILHPREGARRKTVRYNFANHFWTYINSRMLFECLFIKTEHSISTTLFPPRRSRPGCGLVTLLPPRRSRHAASSEEVSSVKHTSVTLLPPRRSRPVVPVVVPSEEVRCPSRKSRPKIQVYPSGFAHFLRRIGPPYSTSAFSQVVGGIVGGKSTTKTPSPPTGRSSPSPPAGRSSRIHRRSSSSSGQLGLKSHDDTTQQRNSYLFPLLEDFPLFSENLLFIRLSSRGSPVAGSSLERQSVVGGSRVVPARPSSNEEIMSAPPNLSKFRGSIIDSVLERKSISRTTTTQGPQHHVTHQQQAEHTTDHHTAADRRHADRRRFRVEHFPHREPIFDPLSSPLISSSPAGSVIFGDRADHRSGRGGAYQRSSSPRLGTGVLGSQYTATHPQTYSRPHTTNRGSTHARHSMMHMEWCHYRTSSPSNSEWVSVASVWGEFEFNGRRQIHQSVPKFLPGRIGDFRSLS